MEEFKTINNFRDLSYLGKIKKHKLFRSASLNKASKEEIIFLKENYHINNIIDLRNSIEIQEEPDNLYDLINYHKCSLQETCDEFIAQDTESILKRKAYFKVLDKECLNEEYAKKHMEEFYSSLANSELFIKGFKEFLNILIKEDDGILWHCSLGRDRAGVVSALLLDILGFDFKIIMNDYLKSNDSLKTNNSKYYDLAHEDYLLAFYSNIDTNYFNKIGIASETIKNLRNKYLED